MPDVNLMLSKEDVETVYAVFASIDKRFRDSYGELNTFMGSVTIDNMYELLPKLKDFLNIVDGQQEESEE